MQDRRLTKLVLIKGATVLAVIFHYYLLPSPSFRGATAGGGAPTLSLGGFTPSVANDPSNCGGGMKIDETRYWPGRRELISRGKTVRTMLRDLFLLFLCLSNSRSLRGSAIKSIGHRVADVSLTRASYLL